MSNPSCGTVRDTLPWLVNGSLSRQQQRPLWQHLAGCDACRACFVECTQWAAALREEAVTAPTKVLADVWQAVHQATVARAETDPAASLRWKSRFFPLIRANHTVREAIGLALASPGNHGRSKPKISTIG
jgi:predicted anti-sigma-YlaC factor YlaD